MEHSLACGYGLNADETTMTNAEKRTLDEEERQHSYTSSAIPWYVRLIWLLFWIFAIYYAVTYLLPALQTEMVNPP